MSSSEWSAFYEAERDFIDRLESDRIRAACAQPHVREILKDNPDPITAQRRLDVLVQQYEAGREA